MPIQYDEKRVQQDVDSIQNLKSTIQIKHLGDIPNHDGVGDKFLIFVNQFESDGSIAFICATDFWSGDLEMEDLVFKISATDFKKINKSNFEGLILSERSKLNGELIQKATMKKEGTLPDDFTTSLEKSTSVRDKFISEIQELDLDLSLGGETQLDDLIITLNTQRTGSTISNKVKTVTSKNKARKVN